MEVRVLHTEKCLTVQNPIVFSERKAVLYDVFSLVMFNFAYFFVKLNQFIKPDYNIYVYISVRYFLIGAINHFLDKSENNIITDSNSNKSFYFRSICLFLDFYLWIISLQYLRYSTIQCILLTSPIILSILTYFILEEPYYPRYFFGLVISFTGALIMTLNENSESTENILQNNSILLTIFGFIVAVVSSFFSSLQDLYAKLLSSNYDAYYLNTKLGYHVSILSFILSLVFSDEFLNTLLNPLLLFSTAMSAFFSFLGFHFSMIAFKYIDLSKLLILEYLSPVFAVIFGYFIIGDSFYFTDFIGICFILSYNFYNFFFPIQSKK